jgi:hypothetical protein
VFPEGWGYVTHEQATWLFAQMAGQKDIAFRFPTDGCYARAHLMVQRMQKEGVFCLGKVWAFAHSDKKLLTVVAPPPYKVVRWDWHVAPTVRVKDWTGSVRPYVIDPSLCKGPVPVDQWKLTMKRAGTGTEPFIVQTKLGEPPIDPRKGRKCEGTGYRPGADPAEGLDAHALATMRRYKPWEGKVAPEEVIKPKKTLLTGPAGPSPGPAGLTPGRLPPWAKPSSPERAGPPKPVLPKFEPARFGIPAVPA